MPLVRQSACTLPLTVAFVTAISLPHALAVESTAKPSIERVIDDAVLQGGKAIVQTAKSAIRQIEAVDQPARKAKSKASKTAKSERPQSTDGAANASNSGAGSGDGDDPAAQPTIQSNPPAASFPKTLQDAKAETDAAKKPPPAWTPQEITDAKARCTAILKRIKAVAIAEPPIREGACGTPAPIQLISIGASPEVAISPPAIMTCDLAEALDTWLHDEVQPLASKHFASAVIRIETMSSYSCRNAYGRAGGKLSEHGLANALDIRGFVLASAKTAYVLEDWGTPQREINAQIAAAKAAAEKAEAARLAAEKAGQENLKADRSAPSSDPPAAAATTSGAPAGGLARGAIIDGIPKMTVTLPGANPKTAEEPALTINEPNRLGGPTPPKPDVLVIGAEAAAAKSSSGWRPAVEFAGVQITVGVPAKTPAAGVKAAFLHQAHAAACRIFGTTLGPEANAAHRNHFHVDMAKRKSMTTKICD